MKKSLVFIIACLLWGSVAYAQPQKLIEKDFEKLYFVNGEEITLIPYDSYDEFIAERIRIAEEADARFQELEKNGGPSWLSSFEEGINK